MKTHELGDENSRTLGLMLAPESIAGLGEELRLAKAALLDWKARWGDKCAFVMWAVVIDSAHHEAVNDMLAKVYDEDKGLSPLLRSVRMQVKLLGKNGMVVTQYERLPVTKKPKPWWKVW